MRNMKRFVLQVGLFALIVIGLFGSWSALLVYMEVTAYERESHMPTNTLYAVCGDSQTELGLNPALWPRFFNFSLSAIQLDQIELKTIDLLERNPGLPKVLLVDISPRKLAAQNITEPLVESRSAGKRFMLHVLRPEKSRRSLNGVAVIFRDAILVKRTKRAWKRLRKGRPYASSIGGEGTPDPALTEEMVARNREAILAAQATCGFRDHLKEVRDGIDEHADELNSWGLVNETSETVRCICDILRYVKSKNVMPILITPPWHPELLAKARPEMLANFHAIMNSISEREGVPYLNHLEMPFPTSEWRDGNHLNEHGAVRYTELVRRAVENIAGMSATAAHTP